MLSIGGMRLGIGGACRASMQTAALASYGLQPLPERRAAVIGVPMHYGQPITGVEQGPTLMREAGLLRQLSSLDWRIADMGDIELNAPLDSHPQLPATHGNAKSAYAIGNNMRRVASAVGAASKSQFALVLGGDHSIAAGSIAGVLQTRPESGIIWVDAHADLNTPTTSPSGNMHGMPLGFVIPGLVDHTAVPGFDWMKSCATLDPRKQLVYIGLRDVDAGEIRMIRDLGILTFTMHDIDRYGIGKVMQLALDHMAGRPLHLSYDIDALDPTEAPSTGTRVPGGLTLREAHYVAEVIAQSGRLRSMDMVEINPLLGSSQDEVSRTVHNAVQITLSAMGSAIL